VQWRRIVLGKKSQPHPFDLEYGIETTDKLSRFEIATGSDVDGLNVGYVGAQPSVVRKCLDALPIDGNTAFVDIGCGKGRVLAVAAEYAFSKVVGIELSPLVMARARKNVEAIIRKNPAGRKIKLVEGDATRFSDPGCKKIVFFLYNPFFRPLVERFLTHLEAGVGKRAKIFLIYYNPVHHEVFDRSATLTRFFAASIPFDEKEAKAATFDNISDSVVMYQNFAQPLLPRQPNADAAIRISIPNYGADIL
jgi:SAM-dependent methyltransferase